MIDYEADIRAIRTDREDIQELKDVLIKIVSDVVDNSDDILNINGKIDDLTEIVKFLKMVLKNEMPNM